MPKLIHNSAYPDDDNPKYANVTEFYKKTGTTEEQWQPVKDDINDWLAEQEDNLEFKTNANKELADPFIVQLAQKHQETGLFYNLVDGLPIHNGLYLLIKRAASNIRRNNKNSDKKSARSSSTESTTNPSMQDLQNSKSAIMDESGN